jgi:hypothetical protein
MLARHRLSKLLLTLAVAGLVAAVAGQSALAKAKKPSAKRAAAACAVVSPYPGWVSITDDLGIPWLHPATESNAVAASNCAQSNSASDGATLSGGSSVGFTPSKLASPYPNWVVVFDEQGVPWLVPSGPTLSGHR